MMEEMMKLLQKHNESSMNTTDSDDSDISAGNLSLKAFRAQAKSPQSSDMSGDGKRTRLPTRRPDPNVYNRNALLARENRRKKKAHLASVERELEEAHKANQQLIKVLKKQIKSTRRLEREKQYYKNLVTNQKEIYSLVNVLNTRLPGNKSSHSSKYQRTNSISTLCSESSYRSYCSSDKEQQPQQQPQQESSPQHSMQANDDYIYCSDEYDSTDQLQEQPSMGLNHEAWNELLVEDFGLPTLHEELSAESCPPTGYSNNHIVEEHSYVNLQKNMANSESENAAEESGICLHISGGKVSLEFCPTCHWNASRTPPSQLLQEATNAFV